MRSSLFSGLVLAALAAACGHGQTAPSPGTAAPERASRSVAGALLLHETYRDLDGNGDGFDLPGWATFGSGFGLEFSGATFTNEAEGPARFLRVVRVPGLETNFSVGYAPYGPPAADAGQWPYLAELIDGSQCGTTAELLVEAQPYIAGPPGTHTEVYGVLANYRVEGEGPTRRLSGYQLLINGGGQSVTLSRFIAAFDHAFDYVDRFPGCDLPVPACSPVPPNPLVDGPYKGWDYRAGPFPAGGNPAQLTRNLIAMRYEYDPASSSVMLRWELRRPDGSDDTPESWDMTRLLTGEDALPPGGSFGYFSTLYSKAVDTTENGIKIREFQLRCD